MNLKENYINIGGKSQDTRQHQLRAITDGVHRGILNHDSGERNEQGFERQNDTTKVFLVFAGVVKMLGVQDIVHGDHVFIFSEAAWSDTTEFLHMAASAQQKTNVLAHGTHVGPGFAGNPENAQAFFSIVFD